MNANTTETNIETKIYVENEQTCTGRWYKLMLDGKELDNTFVQETKGWAMYQPKSVNEVEIYGLDGDNCRVFIPAKFYRTTSGGEYVLVEGHLYNLKTRYEVGHDKDYKGRMRVYENIGWTSDGETEWLDFQPGVNFDFLEEYDQKEEITLNEWLDEADELARQTGIAFGFGRVENWDDARKEASFLSADPDVDLAEAGRKLLEMIPS